VSSPHGGFGGRAGALLLTGGASRRFGATKAELRVDGERLADRGARVLTAVCDPVVEVGPAYSDLPTVCESPAGSGPLAAVLAGGAALAASGAVDRPFVVLAVDLPFVDVALIAWLRDFEAAGAVVPIVDGRAQPLCARYPASALAVAKSLLDGGVRSMQALLAEIEVAWVDEREWGAVTSAAAFADVDTPEDAQRSGIEAPG
jgi:molybdopterin-guanine dinucleotide biosynthesis protein A